MTQKVEYKKMISELLNAYGEQVTAERLGITPRSLYNYLSDAKPTTPHLKTLRKLQETYANHLKGQVQGSETEQKRAAFNHPKEEVIDVLREQITLLKQQNDEYRQQLAIKDRRVDEIFKTTAELQVMNRTLSSELAEVKGLVKIVTAYALAHFRAFQVHRVKTEKQAQAKQIADEMRTLYGEALQESLQG